MLPGPLKKWSPSRCTTTISINDSTRAGQGWHEAWAADRQSLIEVIIQSEAPPLPPGIGRCQTTVLPKVIHAEPLRREIIDDANTREVAEVTN